MHILISLKLNPTANLLQKLIDFAKSTGNKFTVFTQKGIECKSDAKDAHHVLLYNTTALELEAAKLDVNFRMLQTGFLSSVSVLKNNVLVLPIAKVADLPVVYKIDSERYRAALLDVVCENEIDIQADAVLDQFLNKKS